MGAQVRALQGTNDRAQKGVADDESSAPFTKLGREITAAARQGGADLEWNPRLRLGRPEGARLAALGLPDGRSDGEEGGGDERDDADHDNSGRPT